MAVLTLTPSRYAASTDFLQYSYAYIMADRPVTKLGVLVTPVPITLQAATAGEVMSAELLPNIDVDEEEPFLYTVSVFDPDGNRLYSANIVMPETAADIFDIILVTQDLDSCVATTVRDNS